MVSTVGEFSVAPSLRWNGTRAQTLNKKEGLLVGDRKRGFAGFTAVNIPCDSSHNLLEVWLREGMRWTDNQAAHQTGMNWKTKCKLQQLQEKWKAALKKVQIGT